MTTSSITVFFLNNEGGGFADKTRICSGTSLQTFLGQKMPGKNLTNYRLRVNRQIADVTQILQEGDRVTVTPLNIKGAAA